MVVNALSKKTFSIGSLVTITFEEFPFARYFQILAYNFFRLHMSMMIGGLIAFLEAHSSLVKQIYERQFYDEKLYIIQGNMMRREVKEVVLNSDGVLMIGGTSFVPKIRSSKYVS